MKANIKIVTFNLRTWCEDGNNHFMHRIGMIFKKIQEELPDIIAFQEVMPQQHIYLQRLLTEYTLVGQFRNADFLGEGIYVAVKKDSFQVLAYNTFWLSPMPYVPASRFEEQSMCPRICSVVRVRHIATGEIFRIFNLHLDHVGEEARVKGMQCILDELVTLNEVAEFPAVILGDFNAEPDSATIALCNHFDQYPLTDVTGKFPYTFHGYDRWPHEKIDYIFLSEKLAKNVTEVRLWDDVHEGIYLSDHYPICAEIVIGG